MHHLPPGKLVIMDYDNYLKTSIFFLVNISSVDKSNSMMKQAFTTNSSYWLSDLVFQVVSNSEGLIRHSLNN